MTEVQSFFFLISFLHGPHTINIIEDLIYYRHHYACGTEKKSPQYYSIGTNSNLLPNNHLLPVVKELN